jgi:hypothetical protein
MIFSSIKLNIQFAKLANPKHLEQIAEWVENKWGYLRGFPEWIIAEVPL